MARSSAPTRKDRRDCLPPPEQQMFKGWGPRQCEVTCAFRNLLLQQLCGTKSVRESPENQLLEPAAKDSRTHYEYESPAPPPSSADSSWAMCGADVDAPFPEVTARGIFFVTFFTAAELRPLMVGHTSHSPLYYERDRKREGERESDKEKARESVKGCVCVCVCERERERMRAWILTSCHRIGSPQDDSHIQNYFTLVQNTSHKNHMFVYFTFTNFKNQPSSHLSVHDNTFFWYLFTFRGHLRQEPAYMWLWAGWPILFRGPTPETALAKTNAFKK